MNHPAKTSELRNNLDAELNLLGYQMVEDICEIQDVSKSKQFLRNIDKSLGVLVNDGVYAYYLFWKSQTSKTKEYEPIFIGKIARSLSVFVTPDWKRRDAQSDWEKYFQELSRDLRKLLFFREMLEKILIYARYHAKAKGEDHG